MAAAPEATAAGVIREKAVRFASGAEWAIVRGRLHGRDTIDHLVPARAGQALTVFFKAGALVKLGYEAEGHRIELARSRRDLSATLFAERVGISQMHVSRLLAKSLTRLRDELQ